MDDDQNMEHHHHGSEHLKVCAFTIPLCTSGDPVPLSIGSSLDDHEIVNEGWISDDNGPQELLIDLLHKSTIHDIAILAHETWIPGLITVCSTNTNQIICRIRFTTLHERGGNTRIREQVSLTLDPPQSHSSLRFIVEGGINGKQGIVSISIHGVRDDIDINHHLSRHHYHGSNHHIDSELHSLGLGTISEAHIHQGGTAGAHQILANLDEAADSSTGVILDMLRSKKHDLIKSHAAKAEMNDDEANRLSHIFQSFDRVGKAITRAFHVKKCAIDIDHYGLAASASDRLKECFHKRDFLAKKESLRTWCCGGSDSNIFENKVLSMMKTGWNHGSDNSTTKSTEIHQITPWIKAMRAAPLFTLRVLLRLVMPSIVTSLPKPIRPSTFSVPDNTVGLPLFTFSALLRFVSCSTVNVPDRFVGDWLFTSKLLSRLVVPSTCKLFTN